MEDATATPGLTAGAEKSPDAIEREMGQTRESLTQKVAALENQVLGTIQTATNTLTDTVQTVKDTVSAAPGAMKDTVQETVTAVKDGVKETFQSVRDSVAAFSLGDCVRDNPVAAVGASVATGLVAGYLFGGGGRPVTARAATPTLPPSIPAGYAGYGPAPARPGFLSGVMESVGTELQQLAKQAMATALESLKRSVNDRVPRLMDDAVQSVASRVTGVANPADGVASRAADRYPFGTPATGV